MNQTSNIRTETEIYHDAAKMCVEAPEGAKPTKAGVKAALIALTYDYFPAALRDIEPAKTFTRDEFSWANYLIFDDDFGGAWAEEDQYQINHNLV